MELVVPNGVFGPRLAEAPKKGRPRLHTKGRHKVTKAQIMYVEGLREAIMGANNDPQKLQVVVDSIHAEPHIYRILGRSDGEWWEFRVGPMILPFATKAITFSIDVERRDQDGKQPPRQCESAVIDRPTDPPRRVFEGSLVVTTAYRPEEVEDKSNEPFAMMWPPNLRACVNAASRSGVPHSGITKIYWRASDHSRMRHTTALCHSISDIENDAYKLSPQISNCLFLGVRELMLGPKFFDMCRYFASKDLVAMTPFFFKGFCAQLPMHSELIALSFIRNEKSGRRFVDGSCLVRFLDERVTNGVFIDYILPDFADRDCWTALNEDAERVEARKKVGGEGPSPDPLRGKKRGMSQSTDSVLKPVPKKAVAPAPVQGKEGPAAVTRSRHGPTFAADPSSKLCMANWFDTLRAVYYRVIGNSLERGEFYVKRYFSRDELPYVHYLMDKLIIKVYSGFNPRGASVIERHLTERDCGSREEDDLREECSYYVHPHLEVFYAMRSIRTHVTALSASYDVGLQSYTRMKVKNALFEGGVSTYTYADEFSKLSLRYSEIARNKTEAPDDVAATMHARLERICSKQRKRLDEHEKDFIHGHEWPPGQGDVLSLELLTRDPVPAGNTKFWDSLARLARNRPLEYPYARQSFSCRLDKWWASAPKGVALEASLREAVKELVEANCRLCITVFDIPESNVGERRRSGNVPDAFRAAARAISDVSFGPNDVPSASLTTRESLLFSRRKVFSDQNRKLISLHEVEKWTIQDLQEVLSACFFDWEGTESMGPPSQTHVLWIFADRSAIDLGALSALVETPRITAKGVDPIPEANYVDLRGACVQESETAGLAAKIHSGSARFWEEDGFTAVNEALIVTDFCEDEELHVRMVDENGVAATDHFERVQLSRIAMNDLPNLRYGTNRPDIARVDCVALDNWRQIYTLMCYVRRALVLIGSMETLKLLLKASEKEFFVDDSAAVGHHHAACDLVLDGDTGSVKRLIYRPSATLDLFTSFGNFVEPVLPHVMTWSPPDQVSI